MINEAYVTRTAEVIRFNGEPANAALLTRVTAGDTSFSAEELYRLTMMFRLVLINTQATFQQYDAGLIDQRSYETTMVVFKDVYLASPVYRALWLRWAPLSSPAFRAAVENIIRDTPLRPPIDSVASFRKNLAQVTANASKKHADQPSERSPG
jgi:hypothetical protein